MNTKRVTELETFANDFNAKLKAAYETYENKETKPTDQMSRTFKSTSEATKKKKTFSNTVFEDPEAWKPNKTVGNYFEKFNKLNPKHDMNSWEIVSTAYLRVNHMVKRSYAKPAEFLYERDLYPTHAIGTEFAEHERKNPHLMTMGSLGKTIIEKFVKQNSSRELRMRETEKDIWDYRHSKPPLDLNKWKWSNHIIKEFSTPPGDQILSFRAERKKPFLIKEPYRIPRKDGDYFEADIKLI